MKISKIKIKNYRSVKSEVVVDVKNSLTIIGPNNSGKTNFLKGIALFFSAFKSNTYSIENDLSFGVSNEKTSIVISFSASQELDEKFLEKYRGLAELLEENKDIDLGNISLYLNFSSAGRPSYRFFTNDKVRVDKKDDYQKLSEDLVFEFLDNFSCKYIPSEKSTAQLFDDFLLPHLREYVGKLLQSHEKEVSNALDTVSDSIAKNMSDAGLSDISLGLTQSRHAGA